MQVNLFLIDYSSTHLKAQFSKQNACPLDLKSLHLQKNDAEELTTK